MAILGFYLAKLWRFWSTNLRNWGAKSGDFGGQSWRFRKNKTGNPVEILFEKILFDFEAAGNSVRSGRHVGVGDRVGGVCFVAEPDRLVVVVGLEAGDAKSVGSRYGHYQV